MNNLMKGYIDASHSLLDFLKAFESALDLLEYQASEILTNYALKLTQEQLLQSTSYLCVKLLDSKTETMQTYQIYHFNHEAKPGRKKLSADIFFVLQHKLNLNNLPESLFYNQWRKDPSNLVLMQNFHLFCNNIQSPNDKIIECVEDYEYLLSKVFYEIKGLKSQTATNNSKKEGISEFTTNISDGICLFCNQSLPNPLPKKLLDYLKILQNK
ncbi:17720_t:CDS:2, partial [Funneliformis geosporum]